MMYFNVVSQDTTANTVWLCTITGDNIPCCIYYITLPTPLQGNQKMLVISSNTTLYLPF